MTMGTFTLFDTATLWEADGTGLVVASNTFKMVLTTSQISAVYGYAVTTDDVQGLGL